MVLLKEISEGIWGLIVASNQTSEVVTENPFRITMAALDIDVKANNIPTGITRVTLKSSTADKGSATDLVLCNLQYPSCLQQPLDIEIYDGQTLTFAVQGPHKVHLTGYNLQSEPEEMHEDCHGHSHGENVGDYFAEAGESSDDDDSDDDDDDDEDDDDEDEDDDSDEDGFPSGGRKRLRDDEDQDLEDDYEDGYVEGEDQLSSESDKKPKNKKQAKEESNGHATKKTKTNEDKSTTKKNKKEPTATATTPNEPSTSAQPSAQPKKTNSLEMKDLRVGNGPEAKLGKSVAVYYTGRLQSNNKTFDSCLKGKPFRFRLGAGEVIRGWDQGVKGMRVGGKRQLTIPPSLAYGNQKLPDIPANSTLVFDVELKNVF